jgi:hypothetical protein
MVFILRLAYRCRVGVSLPLCTFHHNLWECDVSVFFGCIVLGRFIGILFVPVDLSLLCRVL